MKRYAKWAGFLLFAVSLALALQLSSANRVPQKHELGSGVTRLTLRNGLRIVIVPDRLAPVVTTVMNYLVGSNEAPAGFPGMAHAQEHMMFRGSPGLSANQLAAIADAMGGEFDADTQQTVTQYFFTVPSQDLDVALHIEASRMRGVLDASALWNKERGAIEQEVAQDLSNPQYVFYTKLLSAFFGGTPYDHDALGTRSSFDKTTATMLHTFYQKWYAPNNAILVITGDVNIDHTVAQIETLFGSIPPREPPARPAIHLAATSTQTIRLDTDLPYGLAVVSFRVPGSNSPDHAAMEVLSDVLSSQRGTLYDLVLGGKALDTDFSLNLMLDAGVASATAVFPQGSDGNSVITEVHRILANDLKNGLPADLVEAAKRHELASGEFQKNSIQGLARAWSDAVAVEGRQSPEDDMKAIQNVTVDDVNQVAREYLIQKQSISALLTPQPSGKPVSSKSFGGTEALASTPNRPVALPEWASQAVSRLTIAKPATHPIIATLHNGLRLIVQPETISNSVTLVGHIKNNPNLETPKGQEGVADVLSGLFPYGTHTLSRRAFQTALDDIGADESAGTDLSLAVLSDDFDRGVALLADNLLHPALPEHAFHVVQQETVQSLKGQLQSPAYLAARALRTGLFPKGDPSLRQATPQTVSALTLQDVKAYYDRVFRPDLTTIVVIGNVTPQEAEVVINKHFGQWSTPGPPPPIDLPVVPANTAGFTAIPDKSRVQVEVDLAETIGLNRYNPAYYALELGNHVLGGGFYATRLYRDLRETSGLVYYVGSSFMIGKTRGIYDVSYACDPQNVSKARSIIVRDLKEMQTTLVSTADLRRAKATLLRQVTLSDESVDRMAGGWIERSTLGLPLDEPTIAAHQYVNLSPERVQAAFAKWLRPDAFVEVVEGPNPK